MIKITSAEKFNTTIGNAFLVGVSDEYEIGQRILINGTEYTIDRILLPTNPNTKQMALFVK